MPLTLNKLRCLLALLCWSAWLSLSPAAFAATGSERHVEFAWEATDGAQSYEVEFAKKQGGVFKEGGEIKKTTAANFAGDIGAGHYHVRIRAIDQRGVPGPWSDPIDLLVPLPKSVALAPAAGKRIKGKSGDESSVTFKWKTIPDAVTYQLIVNGDKPALIDRKVEGTSVAVDLPVAKDYSWTVRALSADGDGGEASDASSFTLLGEALAAPEPEYSEEGQRHVTWAKPPHAESFDIKLQRRQGKHWRTLAKKPGEKDVSFLVPADATPGSYRVTVVAKADKRGNSKAGIAEFTIEKAEAAKVAAGPPPWLRLFGAYTPMYWEHGTDADDKSGVDFNILIFNAFQVDAETYFLERSFSVELLYAHWETTLFDANLPGSGVQATQQPLTLNGQDIALKGKYIIPVYTSEFSVLAGLRRSSAFFFYKNTPSTIAVLDSNANYLTIGAGLTLPLWDSGEWRGWAETDHPLDGQGFAIQHATDYRLNANLTSYLVNHQLSMLFLYQFDYKHWLYNLSNPATSGHVVDESHTIGAGLELKF